MPNSHSHAERVEASRKWPETYEEYEVMMDEDAAKPVNFTAKGDREVVAQLFFKLVYAITGDAVGAEPSTLRWASNKRIGSRRSMDSADGGNSPLSRLSSMWAKPSEGPLAKRDSADIEAAAWWAASAAANAEATAQPRSPRRGLWGWLSGLDIKFGRRRSVRELRGSDSVATAIITRDEPGAPKHAGRRRSLREVSSFDDGEPLALTMRDSTVEAGRRGSTVEAGRRGSTLAKRESTMRDLKREESQLKRESTFASRESTRL